MMMVGIKEAFRQNKLMCIIVFLSFAVSIAYSFYFRIKPQVDARAYDTIAWNLVQGYGYRENLNVDIIYDSAISRVGPLYEYLLAGIYIIFGHSYGAVWVLQAFLHSLSAYLIYATALLIFKSNEQKKVIGLIAAAIFGFYPDLIEISAMLMTETMYLLLLILMLYLFFRFFNRHNWLSASLLGFVAAAAVLSRPPVLFLIPILAVYFVWKKQFVIGCVFLFCFFISFVPWSVRNYQIYGQPMPMGAAGSYNFWIGNHAGANGEQEQPAEALEFIATHPIKDLAGESMSQFKIFIRHYPGEFIKLTLLRINKYFSIIRPMGFWFYQHGAGQIIMLLSSAVFSVIIFIFGLAGLAAAWSEENEKLKYLLFFTIITPLIIFATVVETRYRFQIYPFFAILSGYFIVKFKSSWWKNKVLIAVAALIFLNGLLDAALSADKLFERIEKFL